MAKTLITVTRRSDDDIKIRDLLVSIDDVEVNNLHYGHSYQQEITPGHHTISVSNRLFHQSLPFDAIAGHEIHFDACNHRAKATLALGVLGVVPYRAGVEQTGDTA